MKKLLILFFALFSCCATFAADDVKATGFRRIAVRNDYSLDMNHQYGQQTLTDQAKINGPRKAAPAKVHVPLVEPKGEMQYYKMTCIIRDFADGFLPVMDVANRLYFDEDGKTIYLGSLFPGAFYCDELWAEGHIEGNKLTISCEKPVCQTTLYDKNLQEYFANLQMGELLVDEQGNAYGLQDLSFEVVDGHYYLDYTDGMRTTVLFIDNGDGTVDVYNTTYNTDLRPYTGNTALVEVPATAQVQEYVYQAQNVYGETYVVKGRVAVDGNDYYFDSLLPDCTQRTHSWLKGTRSGSTITLENDQFLGTDISYYLYYNGFKTTGQRDGTQFVGEKTKLTFHIDENGVITLNNPDRTFPCAFYLSGNQYEYPSFRHRLEPYTGDQIARPVEAQDVKINTKMMAKYGQVSISFFVNNISVDGKFLDPANLYYCIWLDDEIYTFDKKEYTYIDSDTMTYIPCMYSDSGNCDLYVAMDDRNVAYVHEDMFNRMGVQMVYQVNGEMSKSRIVYVDLDNNQTIEDDPEGIRGIESAPAIPSATYDLAGRKVSAMSRGLYVRNNKTIIK